MIVIKSSYHLDNEFIENPIKFDDIFLLQIGRRYCEKGEVIDSHIHTNFFELTLITRGNGVITTNDISTSVERGDIYLSMPCDVHKIQSSSEQALKYDYFAFSIKNLEFENAFKDIIKNFYSADCRVFKDEVIQSLIGNILVEFNDNYLYSYEVLSAAFKQILIYIIRNFNSNMSKKHKNAANNAEAFCYQIMNYIEANIFTLKSLYELSDIMGYDYSYMSNLFNQTTSQTLSNFYRDKKMEAAKKMLHQKNISIDEISKMLNYSSPYAFSKAFKNWFGISPKKFQKEKA